MSKPTAARSAVPLLIATFLIAIIGVLPVSANSNPQTLPFTQDWSNTGLITADDNWTAVPGIVGYLGNNLTASTDTDPQTVLVGGDSVDGIANQTDPSLVQGGVAEFEIGNPVVALQGTSTADAPNIVITLNTIGRSNIHVSYVLRDIDGTTDDAVQPVAVQYRVGATGTYTNLPAGFVADATSGPSLAILATPVQVDLPGTADNQPIVNVRIITTNASGRNEWVGIDDISVTEAVDDAPAVRSMTPGAGAADIRLDADLGVTFSEPVDLAAGWYAIACGTSGVHTASVSGGPSAYTLNPTTDFAYAETCTMTVLSAGVTDTDTIDPPDGMVGDAAVVFTTLAPPDAAPTVVATTPADSDTGIAVGAGLSVAFDEPVDVTGGWFDIKCTTSGTHSAAVTGGPLTFTLDPSADFANDESCTFTVYRQNVTDQDTDDPPDIPVADHVATFQTVAAPPVIDDAPTVQSTSPGDGAADVAVDAGLSVTFSEAVDVTDGWFEIKCDTSSAHAATVTGGPSTFVVDPAADFADDEACTFTVVGQNVRDQDTNDPPDLMVGNHVTSFHTVAAPPPPPEPPTVHAGGPYSVVEGASVAVSATGSDPDGNALTYRWDLDGDGTFETAGQSATFSAAGLTGPQSVTISVRVTSTTGLSDTDDATVNVLRGSRQFPFEGFTGLADLPNVNDANLGTQFLKFSLGGDRGLDIFEDGHPTSASYACGTTPPLDASETARQQGPNGFRYDPGTGTYLFKWNVDNSWKGTCRVFVLGLNDGSTHNVAFRFGSTSDPAPAQHRPEPVRR